MANPNPVQTAKFKAQQKPKYGERALSQALGVRFPEDVDRALRGMSDRQEYIRTIVERALRADGLLSADKSQTPL